MNRQSGSGIRLEVLPDYEAMSAAAAAFIAGEIRAAPNLLLCAATGSTPTRTYELLARRYAAEAGLFDRLRVMKLDEWGGLPMENPGTCETYLQRHLLGPLHVAHDRYFGFRSDPPDVEEECRRVHTFLEQRGPIDLCVLGLGANGHLALNEPADMLTPHAHVADLVEETVQHPMLRGSDVRPQYGLTIGMADILQTRTLLLLVNGAHKRDVLRRLFSDSITTHLPASFLHLHPNVRCLCDRDATP